MALGSTPGQDYNTRIYVESIMIGKMMFKPFHVLILLTLVLTSCIGATPLPMAVEPTFTPTQTPIPPTLTATVVPSPTETATPTSTPEPLGCKKPPDNYTRVEINGETLSLRTLSMLGQAQLLYGGEIELNGNAITQGSYTDAVSASFGTHAGGGSVDLSVLRRGTYTILWDDIEPILHALRAAGFAAWLREYGELYENSPIHIHAIAIGDQELSPAAEEQLTGPAGYFRGYNGLPIKENGLPVPDQYGGPIICQWIIDLGYQDLR